MNPASRSSADLLASLGGADKLESIVGAFVFNLLSDERVSELLADTDVSTMLESQKRFLVSALQDEATRPAPSDTTDDQDPSFVVVAALLAGTLADLGYPEELISQVIGRLDWKTWRHRFG